MASYHKYDIDENIDEINYVPIPTKVKSASSSLPPKRPKTSAKKVVSTNRNVKQQQINRARNNRKIATIILVFSVLLIVVVRNAKIDSVFKQKEMIKKQVAQVEKQNEQIKISIEQNMNLRKIQKEAEEKLGMKKLDNNQRVYLNLDKKDCIKCIDGGTKEIKSKSSSFISKVLKNIFG